MAKVVRNIETTFETKEVKTYKQVPVSRDKGVLIELDHAEAKVLQKVLYNLGGWGKHRVERELMDKLSATLDELKIEPAKIVILQPMVFG